MKKIKLIAEQTFLLTFLIMLVMGLEGLVSYLRHDPIQFDWYIPFSAIIGSFFCCLPSLLFFTEKPLSKNQYRLLRLFHFLLIYGIVIGFGWLFHWYTNFKYFLIISVAYVINYFLIWNFSLLIYKHDEKLINEALSSIQDED